MSPEQISSAPITSCSDVYGLGAILYEMLTGRPPFNAETPLETMRQVQDQQPKAPRQINFSIDKDLETVCLTCLEKDPGHRYATAEAFAEDLEAWMEMKPIRARSAGPVRRTSQWMKRNKLATAFIATLLFGLIAGLVLLQIVRARERKAQEERAFVLQGVMDQLMSTWQDQSNTEAVVSSAHLAILSGLSPAYQIARREYTVGYPLDGSPVNFASKNSRVFVATQKEMSALLGEPVLLHLKLFKAEDTDTNLLLQPRADFLAVDPAAYFAAAATQKGLIAILRQKLNQQGVWITTTNSNITNLAQLAGKSLVLPRNNDALAVHGKARLAAATLQRRDILSIKEVRSEDLHTTTGWMSSHGRATRRQVVGALLQGKVDVALTSFKRFVMDRHRGLRALDTFPVSDSLYVARAGLAPAVVDAFREARLKAEKVIEVKSNKELDPSDSDEVVHHVEFIAPGYLEQFRTVYEQARKFDLK
jgi:hypothetical protein